MTKRRIPRGLASLAAAMPLYIDGDGHLRDRASLVASGGAGYRRIQPTPEGIAEVARVRAKKPSPAKWTEQTRREQLKALVADESALNGKYQPRGWSGKKRR